jgi:hypothetical protein
VGLGSWLQPARTEATSQSPRDVILCGLPSNPQPLGHKIDLARDVFARGVFRDGVAMAFVEQAHQLSGSLIHPWRSTNHQLEPLAKATNCSPASLGVIVAGHNGTGAPAGTPSMTRRGPRSNGEIMLLLTDEDPLGVDSFASRTLPWLRPRTATTPCIRSKTARSRPSSSPQRFATNRGGGVGAGGA